MSENKNKSLLMSYWEKTTDLLMRIPPFEYIALKTAPRRRQLMQYIRQQPRWKVALQGIGLGFGVGLLVLGLIYVLILTGLLGRVPSKQQLAHIEQNTASEVYGEDGILLGKYYVDNRVIASSEEIPPMLINALIATEDARFFEHRGIDIRALLRVLFVTILQRDDSGGGGSTISQQLAKNLFPRKDYWIASTLINKMQEMVIARRMEKIYSKEELIGLYLNTVPFGGNIYGIKGAAYHFFNKKPENLLIEEAATLTGVLKANTAYNPVVHPDASRDRRNQVLGKMVKYGYLGKQEADSLIGTPLKVDYQPASSSSGLGAHFREHLRTELETVLNRLKKPDGTPYNLYTDGLRIFTTINGRMQGHAEAAVTKHLSKTQLAFWKEWRKGAPWHKEAIYTLAMKQSPRYKQAKERGKGAAAIKKEFETKVSMRIFDWSKGSVDTLMSPLDSIKYYLSLLQTGMISLDPKTGNIKAWVGGIDYSYMQYDHAKTRRQVGSTFKPIVYLRALQSGILPCDYRDNALTQYDEYKGWAPENSNQKYGGAYSLAGALAQSINTISVDLIMELGIDPVKTLAADLGMKGNIPDEPSIALGAVNGSPLEMAVVYATLTNGGLKPTPRYLDRIETADGKLLYEAPKPEPLKRVISDTESALITHMMQGVVQRGTAQRLQSVFGQSYPVAGKTGTTQNQADSWFVGATPRLVTAVWVGGEYPAIHFRSTALGQGASGALPIWAYYMNKTQTDGKLKNWRGGSFPVIPDSLGISIDCPDFLDFIDNDSTTLSPDLVKTEDFRLYLEGLGLVFSDEEFLALPAPNEGETIQQYTVRIMNEREKDMQQEEKREKRKEFWNKVLFKKKAQSDTIGVDE